jgi:hypothetical protein
LSEVTAFIKAIQQEFGQTKIELLKGNQMQLKVIKSNGLSIGYLFGLLSQLKSEYSIKEY